VAVLGALGVLASWRFIAVVSLDGEESLEALGALRPPVGDEPRGLDQLPEARVAADLLEAPGALQAV
jgi:hypothetical protein